MRVNGYVQIVGGVLLATGKLRRPACLLLMGSLIPTTYAGHRFWEEDDEAIRTQQRMHFLKNLGLFGGLILAAVDTEGAPSLGWRTKRRVHQIEDSVFAGREQTKAGLDVSMPGLMAASATKAAGARFVRRVMPETAARRRLNEVEFDPTETLARRSIRVT